MSLTTQDFQAYCHYIWGFCNAPPAVLIDESQWFSPKPADKMTAPEPSGSFFLFAAEAELNANQTSPRRDFWSNSFQ